VANAVHLGPEFALAWRIAEWPVVFLLVVTAVGFVYYFGPDAEQEWVWITPGSLVATVLWILASLGFRVYIANFNSYNATYGAIGGVMIALLWLYITGIMLLVGAELNAEIEHASPYGKAPGEKVPGQRTGVRKKIGAAAARAWEEGQRLGRRSPAPAAAHANDSPAPVTSADKLRPGRRPVAAPGVAMSRERVDASRKVLGGVIVGEVVLALWRIVRRTRTGA
jgi:membrane protein